MAFSLCVWLGLLGASGDYLITDPRNHRVQLCPELSPGGACLTVAGTGLAGSAVNELNWPTSAALDGNGDYIIQDILNDRILLCPAERPGDNCTELFTNWRVSEDIANTWRQQGVAVDWSGRYVLVSTFDRRVEQCDGTVCVSVVDGWGTAPTRVKEPYGVSIDLYGDYLIADGNNCRVQLCDQELGWCISAAGVTSVCGNTSEDFHSKGLEHLAASPSRSVTLFFF